MVLAVFAAFVAGVGTKIKHIPHMGGPDIGAGEQLLDQFLVVMGLVFLGVIALLRGVGMPVQRLAAVFAAADGQRGVLGVELVEPGAVHGGIAAIPAKVMVVRNRVGNFQVGAVGGTHADGRHDGGAGGVHGMAQIVEPVMVCQQVRVLVPFHGDFVAQPPDHNGGVVVVLDNEFPHLVQRVLPSAGPLTQLSTCTRPSASGVMCSPQPP